MDDTLPSTTFDDSNSVQSENPVRRAEVAAQVDEVIGILNDNVEKVLARDIKLTELDCRAAHLQSCAAVYELQAARLRRMQWRRLMIKMGLFVLVVIVSLLLYYILVH